MLSNLLEEIDYTELYGVYSRKEKNSAVSPKNLFKVLVYAYMCNLYSTRKIEIACKRDINFIYLLEGTKALNHNTIARFRSSRLKGIVDDLFNQVVLLLKGYGELSCENLFVDGTKIEGNANKYKEMANDELKHAKYLHNFAVQDVEELTKVYPLPEDVENKWEHSHKRCAEKMALVRQMLSM